jgi:hypothetical protein
MLPEIYQSFPADKNIRVGSITGFIVNPANDRFL